MAEDENSVLVKHALRRRALLRKLVIGPSTLATGGILLNAVSSGEARAVATPSPSRTTTTVAATTTTIAATTTTIAATTTTIAATTTVAVTTTTIAATTTTIAATTTAPLQPTSEPTSPTIPPSDPTSAPPTNVPEPSSMSLVASGIAAAFAIRALSRRTQAGQATPDTAVDTSAEGLSPPDVTGE